MKNSIKHGLEAQALNTPPKRGNSSLYKTYDLDRKTKENLTPLIVYWIGPSRWKTAANLLFILIVTIFCPPEAIEGLTRLFPIDIPLGWGAPVGFGFVSEWISGRLFGLTRRRGNGNGGNGL